jgi:hypothetical protein
MKIFAQHFFAVREAKGVQGRGIDEGTNAPAIHAVNPFRGGFQDQSNALFLKSKAKFRLPALPNDGAQQQHGERQDQHQELQHRQLAQSLMENVHHDGETRVHQHQRHHGPA